MALADKLNYAAGVLFDDDPLANMAANGLYKGGSFIGQKAKAGLERLRQKTRPNSPSSPASDIPEGPIRAPKGDDGQGDTTTQDNKQNWDWLRGILTELSTSLSSIKDILSESLKYQINEQERLSLANKESELENRNNKAQTLINKKDPEERRGGLLGIMGVMFAGLASTLGALISALSNPVLLGGIALLAAALTDKDSFARKIVGAGTEWLKDKMYLGGTDVTTISTNAMLSGAEKGYGRNATVVTKPPEEKISRKPTKSERREIRRNARRASKGLAPKAPKVEIPKAAVTSTAKSVLKTGAKVGAKTLVRTAGRAVPIVSGALSAGERISEGQGALQVAGGVVGEMAGSAAGALAGGEAGAVIGTMIFPGVGTAIGAGIGAIAGAIAGSFGGGWLSDKITGVEEKSETKADLAKKETDLNDSTKELNQTSEGLQKSNQELKSSVDKLQETIENGGIRASSKTFGENSPSIPDVDLDNMNNNAQVMRGDADGNSRILKTGPGYLVRQTEDGRVEKLIGARNWRNNNPGNLEYGPFARSMGAIGTDGRFAIFKSYEEGNKARSKLLFDNQRYSNLSLMSAIKKYAPPSENDTAAYQRVVLRAVGGENKRMSDYSEEERIRILNAMEKQEGFKAGKIIQVSNTSRANKLKQVQQARRNEEQSSESKVVVVKTGTDVVQPPMVTPMPTPTPMPQPNTEVRFSIDGDVRTACG